MSVDKEESMMHVDLSNLSKWSKVEVSNGGQPNGGGPAGTRVDCVVMVDTGFIRNLVNLPKLFRPFH